MNLPRYDYLYPLDNYEGQTTDWIKDQLELAEEEGASEHIRRMRLELAIRNRNIGNYSDVLKLAFTNNKKQIPKTGYYHKGESFWEWLKSFIPLRLW